MDKKEFIARRAARFLEDGELVNLGIGIPSLVANYIPEDRDVWLQTENGIIGAIGRPAAGKEEYYLCDASGVPTSVRPGGCCFDSFASFGYIRGGHVTTTILGAFEVDAEGNIGNWAVPGKTAAGMGGAMDLITGARRVIVTMTHTDKQGNPKIVSQCSLPLTAARGIDYIVTELCVLQVVPEGLLLLETAPGVTPEYVQARTGATLILLDNIGSMV